MYQHFKNILTVSWWSNLQFLTSRDVCCLSQWSPFWPANKRVRSTKIMSDPWWILRRCHQWSVFEQQGSFIWRHFTGKTFKDATQKIVSGEIRIGGIRVMVFHLGTNSLDYTGWKHIGSWQEHLPVIQEEVKAIYMGGEALQCNLPFNVLLSVATWLRLGTNPWPVYRLQPLPEKFCQG